MTHWIMNGKARVAAAAIGAMLALSACGHKAAAGSGGGGSAKGVTVGSESLAGIGSVLDNSRGFTLYHLTKEQNGQIQCTGSCVGVWPPLMTNGAAVPSSMAGLPSKFGTIARPEGGTQVTYDGMPLYTYSGDTGPHQSNGQGIQGVWFAVAATTASSPGPVATSPPGYGY